MVKSERGVEIKCSKIIKNLFVVFAASPSKVRNVQNVGELDLSVISSFGRKNVISVTVVVEDFVALMNIRWIIHPKFDS